MRKIKFAFKGGTATRAMQMGDDKIITANRALFNQGVHFFTINLSKEIFIKHYIIFIYVFQ